MLFQKHEYSIEPTPEETQKYNFFIQCSCGWSGRTYTEAEANESIQKHLNARSKPLFSAV